MRVYLISVDCEDPELFQNALNDQIERIEFDNGEIIDVKFSVDTSDPAHLCALILWEKKDVKDKTRSGLCEEHYRGRYKTW